MRERIYFTINEILAKEAKAMMSMRDYVPGSTTNEYRNMVDKVYDLVDQVEKVRGEETGERAYKIAVRYARSLAAYFNKDNSINCMCPSVMITGASNFPVHKKNKQIDAWGRNYQYYDWIKTLPSKINDLLYASGIIKSGDENAVQLLQEKLENLEEMQEVMKAVNAYYRKHKSLEGCGLISEKQITEINRLMERFTYHTAPFETYELSNNRQNIKSVKQRLESLKAVKESGSKEGENKFFEFKENVDIMRLQLFFEDKPDQEVRTILKQHGFRWAPSEKAWQRQLTNNAKYAMKQVIKELGELKAG